MTLPAHEPLDICGDCGVRAGHGVLMFPLRKPGGWWAICGGCMTRSMRNAEEDRQAAAAKLAKLEGKTRKSHNKARVGSHG